MLEWLSNLDLSTKLIIGLIAYVFFPQLWPKIKEWLGDLNLKSNNPNQSELISRLEETDNLSPDAIRLLTWLELYQTSEKVVDPKLKKALLELPALLVEKKDV